MVIPENLSENDHKLFQSLTLDEDEINVIETNKEISRMLKMEERKKI